MFKEYIEKMLKGYNLNEQEIIEAFENIMNGNATSAQIAGFITALRFKGETSEEITGCARVMREKALRIYPKADYFIDTCGTGGDGANTFNISTAAAIVTAAAGVTVAKHGNRSVSSRSGSADVLEALGVKIMLEPERVKKCIENVGIGFMFAPAFHNSMKYAAAPRKELGIRTVFNILGPLTNPAGAKGQLLGVFSDELVETLARVLLNLGIERALVVHGRDGLDEISTADSTFVAEVTDGRIKTYTINPEDFGMVRVKKNQLAGGDAIKNSEIVLSILGGKKGPQRDITVLNSAASIYIGKKAESINEGIRFAEDAIDSGKALQKLNEFIEYTSI